MLSTLKSSLKVSLISLILILSLTDVPQAHRHHSYSHDGGRQANNPNWMSVLPDNIRLSELSIPGTHESLSFYGGVGVPRDILKTQSRALRFQLESGITPRANTNSPSKPPAEESVPVAASAAAMAYPLAKVRNRTIFLATGTVRYISHLCRDDWFSVPAGVLQENGSIKEGFWQARRRGTCLIKRIEAQLQGAGRGVTSYTSGGTSYGNFIIQGTQTDFRVWSDHELAAENAKSREGKSPGFYITNKTKWPISIALNQVGCLYYQTIQPGEVFKRNTGGVWFTIKANIQPDGKEPRTDWDCVAPVAAVVGTVLLAAATGGTGVFLKIPAYAAALAPIATSTAVTVSGAAVAAGTVAATKALAITVGVVIAKNGSTNLAGQYAGPDWPFRCDQMPTYEIVGGPPLPVRRADGGFIVDVGKPMRIIKVNECGNSMMATRPPGRIERK